MLTIIVITKEDLKITYENINQYKYEGDRVVIDIQEGNLIADSYNFKDLKGLIIKKEGER